MKKIARICVIGVLSMLTVGCSTSDENTEMTERTTNENGMYIETACVEGECYEYEVPAENIVTTKPVPQAPSLENYLAVEQSAMKILQAVFDNDTKYVAENVYCDDRRYISTEDMNTYFMISNMGQYLNKTYTVVDASTTNEGYTRNVLITFQDEDFNSFTKQLTMKLQGQSWLWLNDEFVMSPWQFTVKAGWNVALDGIKLEPTYSDSTQNTYRISSISKVEHKIVVSNGTQQIEKLCNPSDTNSIFV